MSSGKLSQEELSEKQVDLKTIQEFESKAYALKALFQAEPCNSVSDMEYRSAIVGIVFGKIEILLKAMKKLNTEVLEQKVKMIKPTPIKAKSPKPSNKPK